MVYYIKSLRVQYDDANGALDGGDINRGMGMSTTNVYLVPEYTFRREEAANAFSVETTYNEDLCAADVGRSDGKELFRYIHVLWSYDKSQAITKAWLSRTQDTQEGHGRTGDINQDRGGDYLYLCWEYGYAPGDDTAPDEESQHHIEVRSVSNEEGVCVQHVPLRSISFSQDSIASTFRNGQDVRQLIRRIRELDLPDRITFVNLFPNLHVVPIPIAGRHYLMSLDNRRLHVFRAVLPGDTMIPVQYATGAELDTIRRKWTAKTGALRIALRASTSELRL